MKKNIDAMNHPTKVKETIGERIYTIVVYLLLILISATIILPLLHIISGSFSDPMQLLTGNVSFWPKGFTTSMYEKVLKDASIWKGYLNTILYTVLGTLISVTLTACAAYPPVSQGSVRAQYLYQPFHLYHVFQRRHDPHLPDHSEAGHAE